MFIYSFINKNKIKLNVEAHALDPSTQKAEAGLSMKDQSQPQLSETLSQKTKTNIETTAMIKPRHKS